MLLVLPAGLVFPRFAASKADMVAAGVIPIDRLTDIRAPVDVVAARCGQPQLESVYGIQLGPRTLDAASAVADNGSAEAGGSSSSAAGSSLPAGQAAAAVVQHVQLTTGTRLLVSLARARGWAASGGLPDEVRAGRQILKDYTNGKLLFCKLPPGSQQRSFAPNVAPLPGTVNAMQLQQQAAASSETQQQQQAPQQQQQHADTVPAVTSSSSAAEHTLEGSPDVDSEDELPAAAVAEGVDVADPSLLMLSEADLELMEGLGVGALGKMRRPEHKFHKKAARTKGNRGLQADAGGYDGAALSTGKKGGLVRVGGY